MKPIHFLLILAITISTSASCAEDFAQISGESTQPTIKEIGENANGNQFEGVPTLGIFSDMPVEDVDYKNQIKTIRAVLADKKYAKDLKILSGYLKNSTYGTNGKKDITITKLDFPSTFGFPQVPKYQQHEVDELMMRLSSAQSDKEADSIISDSDDLGVAMAHAFNRTVVRPSGGLSNLTINMPKINSSYSEDAGFKEKIEEYIVTTFNPLGPFTTYYVPTGIDRPFVAPYEVAGRSAKVVGYVSYAPGYSIEQSHLWHVWLIIQLENGDTVLAYTFGVRDGMIRVTNLTSPQAAFWRGVVLSLQDIYGLVFRDMSDEEIEYYLRATSRTDRAPIVGMTKNVSSLVFGYPDKVSYGPGGETWYYTLNKDEPLKEYLVFTDNRLSQYSVGMIQTYGYIGLWPRFPVPAP
jgi:hypothetical protein